MVNSMHWYGHVLRVKGDHVLGRTLECENEGQWKKRRLENEWKKHVEIENTKVGLSRDVLHRSKWILSVNKITKKLREIQPQSLIGILPD